MRILLITSSGEDYLQDSIIHGFKQLFGKNVIDYPTKEMLYNDFADVKNIRGNGFTLYGLLDKDLKSKGEVDIEKEVCLNKFDLIVFTSIHRQYTIFYKYLKIFKKTKAKIWIIDGEDTPVLFPYSRRYLKEFLFYSNPHNHFLYFKRELLPQTLSRINFKLPVNSIYKLSQPKNIKAISFSIPKEKILDYKPGKTKLFTRHIVDEEVAAHVNHSDTNYTFSNETDYYQDIQKSKFGITTKRAGWDCMRHYEIAANGAVICFRNLNEKPEACAPHDLKAGFNCISYTDYNDLMQQVNNITEGHYNNLLDNSLQWIKHKTTTEMIKKLFEVSDKEINANKYPLNA